MSGSRVLWRYADQPGGVVGDPGSRVLRTTLGGPAGCSSREPSLRWLGSLALC